MTCIYCHGKDLVSFDGTIRVICRCKTGDLPRIELVEPVDVQFLGYPTVTMDKTTDGYVTANEYEVAYTDD